MVDLSSGRGALTMLLCMSVCPVTACTNGLPDKEHADCGPGQSNMEGAFPIIDVEPSGFSRGPWPGKEAFTASSDE